MDLGLHDSHDLPLGLPSEFDQGVTPLITPAELLF